MPRGYLALETPVYALATAPGNGALAVVRVSGDGCLGLLAGVFSRPGALRAAEGHTVVYGHLLGEGGVYADELTVAVFRAPRSYTGQDSADLTCHGGAATRAVVASALERAGFAPALPGEFTFRAFAAGKMDLARAEAVDELVTARTVAAQADALARLSGGVSREAEAIRKAFVSVQAACAVRLDYGEDEAPGGLEPELPALDAAIEACERLVASYSVGRALREGLRLAIAGRTNAGKSSLFNRLLREERAIVSEEHGTTRDWIEALADFGGVPVTLCDTAGLRESADPVEGEGMRRSRLVAEAADLTAYVVDGRAGLSPADAERVAALPGALLVWNKVDAPDCLPVPPGWLGVSAATGAGIAALAEKVGAFARGDAGESRSAGLHLASERQRDRLAEALSAARDAARSIRDGEGADLVALDMAAALDAIGAVTGETVPEDILEAVFSRFCVGK